MDWAHNLTLAYFGTTIGSIPLPPNHSAVPDFVHDDERDMLSVMDGNRIGEPGMIFCL